VCHVSGAYETQYLQHVSGWEDTADGVVDFYWTLAAGESVTLNATFVALEATG
jgi:hypothetical protein